MANTPKGNALVERFFRSTKEECVWLYRFENFGQAKKAADERAQNYNYKSCLNSIKGQNITD